ncbi:YadA-like family protein [Variovorax sp. KBW07]|uniref:YadA family autotransporter adhesin n=1 Tax=Variovorax sp. KBW07 TaxID=2153358 RepID=UPI0026ABE983|nr:YadA-like family protein [Variovorax sp. KBW07]
MSTATSSITSLSTALSTTNGNVTSLSTSVNTIYNTGTKYFHANSTAADAVASGQDAVAIGPKSVASGANSFAAGNGAKATADGAIAIGFGAQANGPNAIAVGANALANDSQAFGDSARAGNGGAAFGNNADAGGTDRSQAKNVSKGTAIGFGAVVQQSGGVALGSGSVASRAAGVAGYVPGSATADQQAAIAATTSTQAAVSVGDAANGQYRQITGVAAGSADGDAINLAQLKAASTASKASSAQYAINPDGSINYNQITLGAGQAPGGTRISNVAPGVAPTDAVNMSQLTGVQGQLQGQIGITQRIAYSGVAMATAMSTLPQAMTPGKNLMSVGVGNYSGYGAIAVGYSARSNDGKWIYKVNGGYSGTRFNIGVGVGYEFE